LEEMAEQNRELFLEAGGQAYHYIPCLNDTADQMALMTDLVNTHLQGWSPPLAADRQQSAAAFARYNARRR